MNNKINEIIIKNVNKSEIEIRVDVIYQEVRENQEFPNNQNNSYKLTNKKYLYDNREWEKNRNSLDIKLEFDIASNDYKGLIEDMLSLKLDEKVYHFLFRYNIYGNIKSNVEILEVKDFLDEEYFREIVERHLNEILENYSLEIDADNDLNILEIEISSLKACIPLLGCDDLGIVNNLLDKDVNSKRSELGLKTKLYIDEVYRYHRDVHKENLLDVNSNLIKVSLENRVPPSTI